MNKQDVKLEDIEVVDRGDDWVIIERVNGNRYLCERFLENGKSITFIRVIENSAQVEHLRN
jgi:hypothetical protein